jgi:hypothetical protein
MGKKRLQRERVWQFFLVEVWMQFAVAIIHPDPGGVRVRWRAGKDLPVFGCVRKPG